MVVMQHRCFPQHVRAAITLGILRKNDEIIMKYVSATSSMTQNNPEAWRNVNFLNIFFRGLSQPTTYMQATCHNTGTSKALTLSKVEALKNRWKN